MEHVKNAKMDTIWCKKLECAMKIVLMGIIKMLPIKDVLNVIFFAKIAKDQMKVTVFLAHFGEIKGSSNNRYTLKLFLN